MSKNGKTLCAIDSCTRPMEMPESGLCIQCYNGMYYWKDATPTRIMKRQKQLVILGDRMEAMGGNR